jgi:hypothetical protein
MSDTKTNLLQGRVLSYTDGFGQGKLLTLQREPASRWEANNEDRLILALDVPPWVAKALNPPQAGTWVEVEYRLLGREYSGRRYLSAQVSDMHSLGAPLAPEAAEHPTPPAAEPETSTAPDEDMPF